MYLVCDSLHRTIPNVENTRTVMEMLCYYANRMNDLNKDKKTKGLNGKEYIHSLGNDMWIKYCDFLKTFA